MWLGLKKSREEELVLLPPCSQTTPGMITERRHHPQTILISPKRGKVGIFSLLGYQWDKSSSTSTPGSSSKQRFWTSTMFSESLGCSWKICTDGPVHNSRALASGNNLKCIVKEGRGGGREKKNLFSPLPVPPRIFICVCQEQASLPTFSSWCVLLCGALLARRAGRSSEGTPREKIWAQLSNFSWVCFSAPPLPLIPGHPCGNPSLGRADLPGCPSLQEDLPCQDDPVGKRDKEMRILGFNAHSMLSFICPRAAAPQEAPTDTSDPPEATLLFPKGREQPLDARCFSIRVFLIFPFSTSSRAARSILEYSLHGRTPRVQQESSTGVLQVGKQQSHVEGNL